jgi:signal transduction histidine kinase
MTFRLRLLLVLFAAVLVPIVLLAVFVRHEMTGRLTAQYERRVEALVAVIEKDLAQEDDAIASALASVRAALADDNRFRRGAVDGAADQRRYVLDYAAAAMRLAGLSMLQIQDEAGRIVSSGHFRNDYDRMEPGLPALLSSVVTGMALVRARAPDAHFLALARLDSMRIGGRRFAIVGGRAVEAHFLAGLVRESDLSVVLSHPGGVLAPGEERADAAVPEAVVRELSVPFVDAARGEVALATFRVSHGVAELQALRAGIDRWFVIALVVTMVVAVVLAGALAARLGQPLAELAQKTSRVDLGRLDVDFDTRRTDEFGALSRMLAMMTERLRASATAIKEAERRATLGELARQVNHDIKNGLVPIRNALRHLADVARDHPSRLGPVFGERRQALESSIAYLENLAANYARLSRHGERRRCDANALVASVVDDLRVAGGATLRADLHDGAFVHADPVALRRILENLAANAIESLESGEGMVTIATAVFTDDEGRVRVRITVADTGSGMTEEQRAKAFEDFYTTKASGTGLGLSIARRLVMDLDGAIRAEDAEGKGSRFIVELPALDAGQDKG